VHLLCDVAGKIAAGDFTGKTWRWWCAWAARRPRARTCAAPGSCSAAEAHLAEPEAIAALLDGAGIVAGTVATLAVPG
jgi:hypothetical protein